jgi:VanZ family protein
VRPGPDAPNASADAARARADAHRPRRIALAWAALALWTACVLWLGSGNFDAGTTSRFFAPLLRWLLPDAPPEQVATLVGAIRKLAHPVEYALLAWLAFRTLALSGVARSAVAAAGALALALAVAGVDEARQAGLATRTGALGDVALDAGGALGAVAAAAALRRRRGGTR